MRTRLADMAVGMYVCTESALHASVIRRIIHDYRMCDGLGELGVRVRTSNFVCVNTRCTQLAYSG